MLCFECFTARQLVDGYFFANRVLTYNGLVLVHSQDLRLVHYVYLYIVKTCVWFIMFMFHFEKASLFCFSMFLIISFGKLEFLTDNIYSMYVTMH